MSDQGLLLEPGAGVAETARGFGVTFKVGSDRARGASCLELTFAPGVETGRHLHRRLEETFYVIDGEFTFEVGSESFRGLPGAYVFIPIGVPHAVSNASDGDARCLLIMSPPTHDGYFAELVALLAQPGPPDAGQIAALRDRYDTEQISTMNA